MKFVVWLRIAMVIAALSYLAAPAAAIPTYALTDGGLSVTDSQGVTWLSNMDLPASMPLTVPLCADTASQNCINANGSMNYQTALLWVAALNADNGEGYLGRNNWQLPTTPSLTDGCMSGGPQVKPLVTNAQGAPWVRSTAVSA